MRVRAKAVEQYRDALGQLGGQAAAFVTTTLAGAPEMDVADMRDYAIDAIASVIDVQGSVAQALAMQLYDAICMAEGIDTNPAVMFPDAINRAMMVEKVHYYARDLVAGMRDKFDKEASDLAEYYVFRCAYENTVRNCGINNVRYARVPMGGETCDFCMMLASRGFVYHSEATAKGEHGVHAHCVVGDTQVFGPEVLGATRREYQGPIVHLTTASGDHLSVTPNHPILTTRGWVPANEVNDGDYLFRANIDHRNGLSVPDEYDAPPRIEDVFSSLAFLDSSSLSRVPMSAEDFHGDGIANGEVDIVRAYRLLKRMRDIASSEPFVHKGFATAHSNPAFSSSYFSRRCMLDFFGKAYDASSNGFMSSGSLLRPLFGGHFGHSDPVCFTPIPMFDPSLIEPTIEGSSGDAVRLGECLKTLARLIAWEEVIGHGESFGRRSPNPCDVDAETLEVAAKNIGIASIQATDLTEGIPAGVEMCRLVEKHISVDCCHVYNLTTASSWYFANNIITHNCRCIVLPGKKGRTAIEGYDPDEWYAKWSGTGYENSSAARRAKRYEEMRKNWMSDEEAAKLGKQWLKGVYSKSLSKDEALMQLAEASVNLDQNRNRLSPDAFNAIQSKIDSARFRLNFTREELRELAMQIFNSI